MYHVFSKIDFLGRSPGININGNRKHKTFIGGVISLFLGITTISAIIYFSYVMFSRKNYTIVSTENFNIDQIGEFSNLAFTVVLASKYSGPIEDEEKIYFVKAQIISTYPTFINGTLKIGVDQKEITMERCKIDRHYSYSNIYNEWKDAYGLNLAYCPAPNHKLPVKKPFGHLGFNQITFTFHRCENKTDIQDCLPSKVIDDRLKTVYAYIRFESVYFNHDNYLYPARYYLHGEGFALSSSLYKEGTIIMKNIEYSSDSDLIGSNWSSKIFSTFSHRFESSSFTTDDRFPGAFGAVNINYGLFSQKNSRTYYKLQNMLADIGSLLKLALLICLSINKYLSNSLFYRDIARLSIKSLNAFDLEINKINYEMIKKYDNHTNRHNIIPDNSIIPDSSRNPEESKNISELKNVQSGSPNSNSPKIENNISLSKSMSIPLLYHLIPSRFFKKSSSIIKNLEIHFKMVKHINNEFDAINMYEKFNAIDKIQFIISGYQKENIIKDIINPYILSDLKLIEKSNLIYIREELMKNLKNE